MYKEEKAPKFLLILVIITIIMQIFTNEILMISIQGFDRLATKICVNFLKGWSKASICGENLAPNTGLTR
jgi:hypothetical protein